jgi:hypothetical protein
LNNNFHLNINGNHNKVIISQSNYQNYSGDFGCLGCLFYLILAIPFFAVILLISFVSIISANVKYKPTDNQKWFESVHGIGNRIGWNRFAFSHSNQINYRKSCQLCKDELCNYILEEHIKPDLDLGRIHWSDSTKEKCPICKFNLKLSKTELKKIYSESQKPIQYLPIFFEEYPMIDNDIIPWGCKSTNWISKQKI